MNAELQYELEYPVGGRLVMDVPFTVKVPLMMQGTILDVAPEEHQLRVLWDNGQKTIVDTAEDVVRRVSKDILVLRQSDRMMLTKLFLPFFDLLWDSSNTLDFYRGRLFQIGEDVCIQFVGSDEKGNIQLESLQFNITERSLLATRGYGLIRGVETKLSLYIEKLLDGLCNMPLAVSQVFFDISNVFEKSIAQTDPVEPGSVKLYLSGDLDLALFCLEGCTRFDKKDTKEKNELFTLWVDKERREG